MEKRQNNCDEEPLILTKLMIPPVRGHLMARPQLAEQLEQARPAVLTLLSAPAGFGKTALLADWARSHHETVAWVSLDEGDNDPVRFWRYLLRALSAFEGLVDTSLAMLHAPQHMSIEQILTPLVNTLAQRKEALSLVLDDYHLIHEVTIHDALSWFLEQLSPSCHVIIASRREPPLPLARLRARNQLCELGGAALRLSQSEAATFLTEVMALPLSQDAIRTLTVRTEGWIAGLQLAALSLQTSPDPEAAISAIGGTQRHIFDFLTDEIVARQAPEVQQFLLETSILGRLCSDLCDAVCARQDSQRLLEQLEAAKLFLFPLDAERTWYRYHQLFAEVLRELLRRNAPQRACTLQRRAAHWFAQRSLVGEALEHALAGGDLAHASSLLEREAPRLLRRGELNSLERALSRLPEAQLQAHPRFCALRAWARYHQGQTGEAERWLEQARKTPTQSSLVQGEIAAVQGVILAARGEVEQALAWTKQAEDQLPEDHPLYSLEALTLAAQHFFSGDAQRAARAFRRAARLCHDQGNLFLAVFSLYRAGKQLALQGRLREAQNTYLEVEALATISPNQRLPLGGLAYSGLGELEYEWNRVEEAERLLEKSAALCRQASEKAATEALLALAQVKQTQGHHDAALDLLEAASRVLEPLGVPGSAQLIAAEKARLWVQQGQLEVATRWASEVEVASLPPPVAEQVQLAAARIDLALAQPKAALARLERLRAPAIEAQRMTRVLTITVLQAAAHEAQGRTRKGLELLSAALAQAEPEGFVRLFADEGAAVASLLVKLRAAQEVEPGIFSGWTPAYLDSLLAACGDPQAPAPSFTEAAEPLTERELDVLQHIALGSTNKQIAKALDIAPSTVKWHVNTILGKLHANNRTQAVARARALGFL